MNNMDFIQNLHDAPAESIFRFITDTAPVKIWTADAEMNAVYYNQEWFDFTGLSSVEELRNIVWQLIHPDDLEAVKTAASANRKTGTSYEIEHRLLDRNSVYRWHLSRSKPLPDSDGNVKMWIGTCIDIEDQKQNLEATSRNENYFRFLADHTPTIIWQTDMEGTLNYISEQWVAFSGLAVQEALSIGWKTSLHPEDIERQASAYQEALKDRQSFRIKFRLRNAAGIYRWFLSVAEAVFDGKTGYLGTLTDITEQEAAQQQSDLQLKKMDEFVSIASHELKTPLTSLKLYLQLLDRAKATGQEPFISRSLEQIKRLERLTSDLLDVSKISAGKLVYNVEDFDFTSLIRDAVEAAQNTTDKHLIILKNSVSAFIPGDRFRLEQVFTNVLSNAIKYSPDSDTIIVDSAIQGNYVVVSVQDFGIGIKEDDLAKLFQRFYRVDATAMKYEGLGLGLFIVSEILIRHKGDFWIESEPGKGSTFYFKLPIAEQNRNIKTDTLGGYEDNGISIFYNPGEHLVEVDWKGFQDLSSVKYGCMKMYHILKANKAARVLNDNSNITGVSDASEWVANEWFPMMEAAGLRYFAWVFSTVMFNNISAQKAVNMMQGNVITQFFTSTGEARDWLNKPNAK